MPKVVKNKRDFSISKCIALPVWLWELIEKEGPRSRVVREELQKNEKYQYKNKG